MIAQIMPIAEGFEITHQLNINKRSEDTFRQGRNHVTTAIFQSLQNFFALKLSTRALIGFEKITEMPTWVYAACMSVPFGMAWAVSREISNIYIRPIINFIHAHQGTLAQLAALVSAVALIVLGHTAFATTALIYLTLGFLERQHLLPEKVRQFLNGPGHVLGDVASLLVGDTLTQLVAIADIFILIANKWAEYNTDASLFMPVKHKNMASPPLAFADVTGISSLTKFKVNKGHVNEHLMPAVPPTTKMEDLIALCDTFPWQEHIKALQGRLHKDSRWSEVGQFEGEASKTIGLRMRIIWLTIVSALSKIFSCLNCLKTEIARNEALIKNATVPKEGEKEIHYLKTNLRNFVESIKYKRIYQGEPQSYDQLQYYCKFIAHHLPKQSPQVIADKLITLGLEGGDYCGPGKYQAAADVFGSLMGMATGIDLKTRVFHVLQQERRRIFDELYFQYWNHSSILTASKQLTTPEDIHTYNQFVNLIGTQFGLPEQGAEQDATAIIPPFSKYLFSKVMADYIKVFWKGGYVPQASLKETNPNAPCWQFWKRYSIDTESSENQVTGYTVRRITEAVKEAHGTSQLPAAEVTKWWYNWLVAKNRDTDADSLIAGDEGLEAKLPRILNWTGSRKELQERMYKTMLVEMQVLRV